MDKIRIPAELRAMNAVFERAGFEAYLVGGAVRDMLMGKRASDWDVATNASPGEVSRLFRRVIPTGIAHGTVTVVFKSHHVEVTTFRTEQSYSDGRHPDKVEYAATIEEDLSRRDFTMNAIAARLKDGRLTDPFGGKADIERRVIRCVGDAAERFGEDGLRPVRAVRFASQLGFAVEERTLAAIRPSLGVTAKVAAERFRDELLKMLKSERPSEGLRLMEQTGITALFLPELCACRGVEQKGFHSFDVLDHLYYSCDGAPRDNAAVRLAALLHDIGKPAVRAVGKGGAYTFYQHEAVGAKMAQSILDRLRFAKQTSVYVCHLIRQHMFFYEENWTDAAVRRFLMRIKYAENPAVLGDLFALRMGDLYGMNRQSAPPEHLFAFAKRIEALVAQENALSLKDLSVNGGDLIAAGIPAGKTLGIILNELLETVVEDPAFNTKEKLLPLAVNLYREYSI